MFDKENQIKLTVLCLTHMILVWCCKQLNIFSVLFVAGSRLYIKKPPEGSVVLEVVSYLTVSWNEQFHVNLYFHFIGNGRE